MSTESQVDMAGIIQAFQDFFSFIGQVFSFVGQMLVDLVYTVRMLGAIAPNVPSYLRFLPPAVGVTFTSAMAIIVIYKILGRD